MTVAEVCRKRGISEATYYNWKKKYGGLGVPELRRLKQLEEDNLHLKQLEADLSLDKQLLQGVLKQPSAVPSSVDARLSSSSTRIAPRPVRRVILYGQGYKKGGNRRLLESL